jgi:tRNA pseudouridine38-40 synthase
MRWKCTVAYDGTAYEGWQAQPSGNTVQDNLERRLAELFERRVVIHGSGRTDSGVHARGQVFHFDGAWNHGEETLLKALRTGYPDSIQVISAEVVDDRFHARLSAKNKRYVYQFYEGYAPPFMTRWHWSLGHRRLDLARLNEAGSRLLGKNDFSAFTANPKDDREEDPVKELRVLEAERTGDQVILVAEADSFLFRMVRSLAGFLVDVGTGKLEVESATSILESRRRTNRVKTAPPEGLFLDRVDYADSFSVQP